jgi:hypothetical protein
MNSEIIETVEIDWAATRANLAVINISAWARSKGFCSEMVRRVLHEKYTYYGKKYFQVLEELRQGGFLVEIEKQEAA